MNRTAQLTAFLSKNSTAIGKVVDFNASTDALYPLDFSSSNVELTDDILGNTDLFSTWIEDKLTANGCRYGIGGYGEHRTIYSRSAHFDAGKEPRRLHLGTDIWGPAGTPVYNFRDAVVHSFQFNDHFGDYGATIILKYTLDDLVVHGLYGHLNLDALKDMEQGTPIAAGACFASFGRPEENGHWPPHLHFQLIFDLQNWEGDYPGVCRYSEKGAYLVNCPDPALILKPTFQQTLS
ncbi:MAG: peptidoglycan DD-metalloendopeptidase family protein [Bacteroidota bacterium]